MLPILSKINTYADEYIIGEMLIFDTGAQSVEPNNCVLVRVIIYNDGWLCAWFDNEAHAQDGTGLASFVDAQTLGNFGTICEYPDKYNGCYLVVNSSSPTDSECPDGTIFCIRDTDHALGQIKVHDDCSPGEYHFNTGHTYTVSIYMSNGNLMWWGVIPDNTFSIPIMANRLYRGIYEMWENLKTRSNATAASNAATYRVRVYSYHSGYFYDDTTDFNDSGANDVTLASTAWVVDDAVYYGLNEMFNALELNIGQAGVGNTIAWEYWDGSAWASLSVIDSTTGFTVAGTNTVTFVPPDDWTLTDVDNDEQYWIRSRLSVAAFTTNVLLTQGWFKIPDSLGYQDANLGMYSFEDIGAKYCLLCGKACSSWTFFYNTVLLGKTIYNHVINWGSSTGATSLYVNDAEVNTETAYETQGYICVNIEDVDAVPGIQNVIKKYGTTFSHHTKCAAILITD